MFKEAPFPASVFTSFAGFSRDSDESALKTAGIVGAVVVGVVGDVLPVKFEITTHG